MDQPWISRPCTLGEHAACLGYAQDPAYVNNYHQSVDSQPDGTYIREGTANCGCPCHHRLGEEPVGEVFKSSTPRTALTNEQYQAECRRTRGVFNSAELMLRLATVGISGEAGEIANLYEKEYIHGHPSKRAELIEELGDLLWYWTLACDYLGIPIGEVMARNIEKLKIRYPQGWNSADSIARVDHAPEPSTTIVAQTRLLLGKVVMAKARPTRRRGGTRGKPEAGTPRDSDRDEAPGDAPADDNGAPQVH